MVAARVDCRHPKERERGQEEERGMGMAVKAERDGICSNCLAHLVERRERVADGRSDALRKDKRGGVRNVVRPADAS